MLEIYISRMKGFLRTFTHDEQKISTPACGCGSVVCTLPPPAVAAMETMGKIKNILGSYRQISLEPVFLLFSINIGLISIASRSIYIDKTCKVNLNETEAICDNIQEFNETQNDVQKYVSDIQAYNGALQVIIHNNKTKESCK